MDRIQKVQCHTLRLLLDGFFKKSEFVYFLAPEASVMK